MNKIGYDAAPMSTDDFAKLVRSEVATWSQIMHPRIVARRRKADMRITSAQLSAVTRAAKAGAAIASSEASALLVCTCPMFGRTFGVAIA